MEDFMSSVLRNCSLHGLAAIFAIIPAAASAQAPKAATYITDEEVKAVNAIPGIDRTIRVVDIGNENFAIGIIHRGATGGGGRNTAADAGGRGAAGGGAAGAGAGRGAGGAAGRAAGGGAQTGEPCGEQAGAAPAGGVPGGIAHDSQTEGYLIVSGGGTLITGGRIVNGRKSAPDAEVTKVLNGPSCSGTMTGDLVKKVVKTGDIIIIPAGVPHGWTDITDHVDYLSFRPSDHVLQAGYVHPAIKK
jgi:hypothetical protein